MHRRVVFGILLLVLASLPGLSSASTGTVDWSLNKQLNLEAAPLDVAASPDGKYVYVLVQGEILVYSRGEDKIIRRIPVENAFDRITLSLLDNTLIVTSSSDKVMKLIELEVVHSFDLSGLAHKGPANAPVALVVFSDYQ